MFKNERMLFPFSFYQSGYILFSGIVDDYDDDGDHCHHQTSVQLQFIFSYPGCKMLLDCIKVHTIGKARENRKPKQGQE